MDAPPMVKQVRRLRLETGSTHAHTYRLTHTGAHTWLCILV